MSFGGPPFCWGQSLIMKIWTCSVLTVASALRTGRSSPTRPCEEPWQDWHRIWWRPLLYLQRPRDIMRLSGKPPIQSVACWVAQNEPREWRRVCRWGIRVIKLLSGLPKVGDEPNTEDTKGHDLELVAITCTVLSVTVCRRRQMPNTCAPLDARRNKHLQEGHEISLEMQAWKLRCMRPRWRCSLCFKGGWASSLPLSLPSSPLSPPARLFPPPV